MKSLENLGVQALSARFMLGKACGESQIACGLGFTLSLSLSFVGEI